MEGTSWNLHQGSYLMERMPWKLPYVTYTMEVTSGTYTMEVTKWNLHHGTDLMELTPWKLPSATYAVEGTR